MTTRMTDRARLLVLCSSIAIVASCGDNGDHKEPPDPSIVQLGDGKVQGSVAQSSRSFLGIPYAKPPVGDLRWKAPQKPGAWTDVRSATEFGKRCAQLGDPVLQNAPSTDE